MERGRRNRRRFFSEALYESGLVYFGALLFIVCQILRLINLFSDVAARKAAEQAPPEEFTTAGIVGAVLVILLMVWLFVLLSRQRKGQSRLSRAKRYLLMNLLTAAWGIIFIIQNVSELFVYFEFIYLLDLFALAAAMVAPAVLLQLADSKREAPDDTALLMVGIGGTAFSVISLLIYALVFQKSYSTFLRLVPELGFRIACGLFGGAVLARAIRLRGEYPIDTPVATEQRSLLTRPAAEKPRPAPAPAERDDDGGWMSGFDAQFAAPATADATLARPQPSASDFAARGGGGRYAPPVAAAQPPEDDDAPFEQEEAAPAPRKAASARPARPREESLQEAALRQLSAAKGKSGVNLVRSIYESAGDGFDDEPEEAPAPKKKQYPSKPPRPKNGQGTSVAARELDGEKALYSWQKNRMRRENEFEEERWQTQQLERPPIAHPYDGQRIERKSCPICGKRIPADFPVCPRCGADLRDV